MVRIGNTIVTKVVVEIEVHDIDRAKAFYEDVFDLKTSWYMPGCAFCELCLPGEGVTLGLVASAAASTTTQRGQLWFEVGAADLVALREHMQGKGLAPSEIVDKPGEVSFFTIQDSEGNTLSIGGDARVSE